MSSRYTIGELSESVGQVLALTGADQQTSGRITAVPDIRTLRYYTTRGLLAPPEEIQGRTAFYGRKHLIQAVAIKRLQAAGESLVEIQQRIVGATDKQLEQWANIPDAVWDQLDEIAESERVKSNEAHLAEVVRQTEELQLMLQAAQQEMNQESIAEVREESEVNWNDVAEDNEKVYSQSGDNELKEKLESDQDTVHLFTDGGCSGNPGPGGWAYVLRHLPTGKEKVASGGVPETTNNRMELEAVIQGLEALSHSCSVVLFTDSVYVGKGINEWLPVWKKHGWKRKEMNRLVPILNVGNWQRLDAQLQRHHIEYVRVAGHSGHPENERCVELAVAALQQGNQADPQNLKYTSQAPAESVPDSLREKADSLRQELTLPNSGIKDTGIERTPAFGASTPATADTQAPSVTTGQLFHVERRGVACGPYSFTDLQMLVNDGLLTSVTLVWKNGSDGWHPASQVEELSALFSSSTSPQAAASASTTSAQLALQWELVPGIRITWDDARQAEAARQDPDWQRALEALALHAARIRHQAGDSTTLDMPVDDHTQTPSMIAVRREETELLEQAMDALKEVSEEYHNLIVAVKLEGQTYGEIAKSTGKSVDAVRMQVERAQAELAKIYQRMGQGG